MMSQVEYYATGPRSWWQRLLDGVLRRSGSENGYALPSDSLFADGWSSTPTSIADIPDELKAQIREEAVLDTFHRLESSLRLLLFATTPEKEPPTAERCQQVLNVWRYELEHKASLVADTYCGAVQRYEPEMEAAYVIDGRCGPGDLLQIRVPCWRMFGKIVIRGEADVVDADSADRDAAEQVRAAVARAANGRERRRAGDAE